MYTIIDFLRRLQANNAREWFVAHKSEYLLAQERFSLFAEDLIRAIAAFDPQVAGLTVRDVTYRIYRDTRFSHNKTPYKTHMGAFVCRGGKKSGYAGYYFQVGTSDSTDRADVHWEDCHIIAPGHYCLEPRALRVLREDIAYGDGDFDNIVRHKIDSRFVLQRDQVLKRNPRGFEKEEQWAEYLRLKNFVLVCPLNTEFVTAPNLVQRVAEIFRTAQPFVDYINRAIDFSRNETP